jgi:hypothetical protein
MLPFKARSAYPLVFTAFILILASHQANGFLTPATTRTCRKQENVVMPSSSTALLGIPKMFRWLTDQYPDVLNRQLEQGLSDDLIVDNFYLDMNGIIHPCTHGNNEGEIVILDETAMFKKIFLYVDRYVKIFEKKLRILKAVNLLFLILSSQTIQVGPAE